MFMSFGRGYISLRLLSRAPAGTLLSMESQSICEYGGDNKDEGQGPAGGGPQLSTALEMDLARPGSEPEPAHHYSPITDLCCSSCISSSFTLINLMIIPPLVFLVQPPLKLIGVHDWHVLPTYHLLLSSSESQMSDGNLSIGEDKNNGRVEVERWWLFDIPNPSLSRI
ncbi:hypothetical protein C8J55DRAFT_491826 [Lentinula edodes]|uniref:Uncharacterized protein n=1 Tax=Lentinula lateritia TaxID=40482 RepID=A0A9W8ZYQ9_9AGAR|nr:hypothetical protein C8J55DRAFT_491826 [Lentinula edodes]